MLTRQVIVDQEGKTIGVILPVEEYSLIREVLERATQSSQANLRDRAEAALMNAGLIRTESGPDVALPVIPPTRRKSLAEAYSASVPLSDLVRDDRERS